MSESVVQVDLRQATLSESARLREGEDGAFLTLDAPPPVRSLLRLIEGESMRAFEVARVIEVVDEQDPARGCYGTFVDAERLAEQTKVGSEHLSPGISNSGVPSPVVIMNTADMELGEAGEEGEADAEAQADAEASADAEAQADAGDAEGGETADAEAQADAGDAEGGEAADADASEDEASADSGEGEDEGSSEDGDAD